MQPRTIGVRLAAMLLACAVARPCSGAAATPNISVTPSPAPAGLAVGSTYTYNVVLTDSAGDGASLYGYDVNVILNYTYLEFVGSAPYTSTDAGFSYAETTNNTLSGTNNSDLRISYDVNTGSYVDNAGLSTTLGTFQVQVLTVPNYASGALVTFGTVGVDASSGGSDLYDNNGNQVLASTSAGQSPVPEPSAGALWSIATAMLISMARRRRARAAEEWNRVSR